MNEDNARLRYDYIEYLTRVKRHSETTIDAALRHLAEFEEFTGGQNYRALTKSQAKGFSDHVSTRGSKTGSDLLSASSIVHTLSDVKAFFVWLNKIKEVKVDLEAIEFISPSRETDMMARIKSDSSVPSPEDICRVLNAMPVDTILQRRNRALIAFIFLTGMRDGAVITLCCKHVKLSTRQVHQDPREVHTKFSKNMLTSWFPVGDDVEQIVTAWVEERFASGVDPDEPLFPATALYRFRGKQGTATAKCWKTAGPVRKVFREACQEAGIDNINPHSLRKTLMGLGLDVCSTWEELKAWSQNLGHEKLDTSMVHYGKLNTNRQNELMQGLVRTDVTVREEQELLIKYRAAPAKRRDSIREILTPN